MRYFIELSYRGTAYHGWQTQANGVSVQTTLEAALSQRLQHPVYITGSGRTDAGVHARQQFAHFDREEPLALTDQLVYSLNCILPDDIAIRTIFPVRADDHARFSAISRYYHYYITRQKNVFEPGLTYHFRPELDVAQMNEACRILMQHRDFKSFSKVRANVSHFRCLLDFAYWERDADDRLTFHIKANRFLWGMVRTIVGTMLEIGQGRMNLDQFSQLIEARDRTVAGRAAPANGLYLVEVGYPAEVLAQRILFR
ncbi:tRNA pseudouridine(38-40) synthase TruA [Spirosoma taeanense]|uniref:tRNA pseudouridine synthase A n=1 Tax=Spirosoma taeanense TaxID=2735870 RepID=A0A6M5YAK7_9BACT|nr:tRNA pseudouridine(38-40) synthase TruA [Spirosoma taeanense]QJW90554.1 tRNA pseudouridine(38-40) synthase TruA [Spirosoma taeanense]